jgi:opacity protein-like surface antigen
MKRVVLQFFAVVVGIAAFAVSGSALAQSGNRQGKYEFSLSPIWTQGATYNFSNGASAKTDVGWGLGLNWAYNFTNNLSAGIEASWGTADYHATVAPGTGAPGFRTYDSSIDTGLLRAVGTYNFMQNQFTPFVTAGLGAVYIDTNIPTGPTTPVCWWYPYWGYVCGGSTPTKSATEFTYNAGVGIRWDAPRPNSFFFRGLYNREWVDFGGYAGTIGWNQFRLDFGIKF